MELKAFFPFWDQLTWEQQHNISAFAQKRTLPKGTVVHNGSLECTGLLAVCSGQLRVYSLSDAGREVTLYRLLERDLCLFSASCMLRNIQFELTIQAEKDTTIWVIPPDAYRRMMEECAVVANYTNEIMASRFSEVMWLMEQIMWKSFDKRLAAFLVEECSLEGTEKLKLTHEGIGNHLGTAREVVTRMLRYFQNEGMVKLSRGAVEVTDLETLQALSEE